MKNLVIKFCFASLWIPTIAFGSRLECDVKNVTTYYGKGDLNLVFESDGNKITSLLTLTAQGKKIKAIRQDAFAVGQDYQSVFYEGVGDAVDITSPTNETKIPGSHFSIVSDILILYIQLDLPNTKKAIYAIAEDCL
jgi:hypothetical protein